MPDITEPTRLSELLAPIGLASVGPATPVGDGYGFASERVAVTVRDRRGDEHAAVVKVWDPSEFGLAEIEFYDEWAQHLTIRLPGLIGTDATADVGVLVLEDLRLVRQGDAEVLFNVADVSTVARVLATAHRESRDRSSDLPRRGQRRPGEWHDSRRVEYVERFSLPRDDVCRSIVIHSDAADAIASELLSDCPLGILHGDVHQDNIVFLADGTPVVLDWARVGWGAGALDLADLLIATADPVDYGAAIDAYREIAPVTDPEIHAAVLRRLVTGTLGIARWHPRTARQHRLVTLGRERAEAAAGWLETAAPGLVSSLSA